MAHPPPALAKGRLWPALVVDLSLSLAIAALVGPGGRRPETGGPEVCVGNSGAVHRKGGRPRGLARHSENQKGSPQERLKGSPDRSDASHAKPMAFVVTVCRHMRHMIVGRVTSYEGRMTSHDCRVSSHDAA